MPLIEVVDPAPSAAGYKFDLLDTDSKDIVKVFATRDAVLKAIAATTVGKDFDAALVEAASTKFDRGNREEDGTLLIKPEDVPG